VSAKRTDTGGEFTSSAATGHPDDRQEARTVVTVSPPVSPAREQTANSEFATGVRTPGGHSAMMVRYRPKADIQP